MAHADSLAPRQQAAWKDLHFSGLSPRGHDYYREGLRHPPRTIGPSAPSNPPRRIPALAQGPYADLDPGPDTEGRSSFHWDRNRGRSVFLSRATTGA